MSITQTIDDFKKKIADAQFYIDRREEALATGKGVGTYADHPERHDCTDKACLVLVAYRNKNADEKFHVDRHEKLPCEVVYKNKTCWNFQSDVDQNAVKKMCWRVENGVEIDSLKDEIEEIQILLVPAQADREAIQKDLDQMTDDMPPNDQQNSKISTKNVKDVPSNNDNTTVNS